MKYWDASALVPLVVSEARTPQLRQAFRADPQIVTWWATKVECASAIARRARDDRRHAQAAAALEQLEDLSEGWQEVPPTESIRRAALRLLRVHALRAADALQLAAALEAADGSPAALDFVVLDERLTAAAHLEGFAVLPAQQQV